MSRTNGEARLKQDPYSTIIVPEAVVDAVILYMNEFRAAGGG
jgi:hypothetical protein